MPGSLGSSAPQCDSPGGAAGEEDAVHAAVAGQGSAGFFAALDEIENSGRKSWRPEAFGNRLPHARRLLAGFQDDRVAGQKRRNDMAVGQMARHVEGPQNPKHPVGTEARESDRIGQRAGLLAAAFTIRVDGNGDFLGHGIDFVTRFPKRLGGLGGNDAGDFFFFGKVLLFQARSNRMRSSIGVLDHFARAARAAAATREISGSSIGVIENVF